MRTQDITVILLLIIVFCIAGIGLVSAQTNTTNSTTTEKSSGGGLCLPGFYGVDCMIVWLFAVVLFFLAAVFRKNVANDLLNYPFSLIGASLAGELIYLLALLIIRSLKWGMLIGLVGMLAGGFLLNFFGDTEGGEGGD